MTGASHTLEGFINAMSLEERSLRIITQIEYSRIIGRDWKIEEEELTKLIFEFSPKGISEKSIAKMYLERQRRFAGRAFGVEFKPKVTSSGAGCGWPLSCSYKEKLFHIDHILPKSAHSDEVGEYYDASENSLLLCPTHNVILKGNNIAIGLWIRGMI